MCRASTHPRGAYRCSRKSTSPRFLGLTSASLPAGAETRLLDALRTITGNTMVTTAAENVDLTEMEGIERLQQIARAEVAFACMDEWDRLSREERRALIRDLEAPNSNHISCSIFALIGEVCTLPGKLVGDAATAIGDRVAEHTNSPLAGKMAAAAAGRLMTNVMLQATPIGQAAQIGTVADLAAVQDCPSQRAKGRPRHAAVEECVARLAKLTVEEVMNVA
jgi:hypothetical protein